MQITNIRFASDHRGDYWVGDLLHEGQPAGKTGSYYTNGHRPSREDQIAALLFDERVIDRKYRTALTYDGGCGFCRRTAKLVRELDKNRLLIIAPTNVKFVDDFLVSNDLNRNGLWGVDAAIEICELVFGPGNWIAQLMRVRPVKWLLWHVHYWVMNNRGWLIRFWNSDEVIDESSKTECNCGGGIGSFQIPCPVHGDHLKGSDQITKYNLESSAWNAFKE